MIANGERFIWVDEDPASLHHEPTGWPLKHAPAARQRRRHNKSREGCKRCKHLRRKCDEIKPSCGHCRHVNAKCQYGTYNANERFVAIGSSETFHYAMSRRNTRAYVVRCLLGSDSGYEKSNALELLDHFLDAEDSWIGSPRCQKIIQTHGIQLALSAPHFLHAILAFSANHLSSLLGSRGREYETAADLHYGLSLQGYVSEIQQLKVENADQIIGSCLLHSMLALLYFSHEKDNPEDIPDTEKCDLTWLRLLQASPIIRSDPRFRDSLRESVWLPVLTEYGIWKDNTDQSHSPDSRMTDSTSTLSPTKTSASPDTVDGLDDVGVDVPNEDLFSKEAMRLELLLAENVDHTRIDRLMLFAGTLQPNFIDLLYARDEKALFIIIHWLVLLLQVGQWWMSRSARFGLARICIFLYRSSGPEVRAMLELPAAQCGLRLSALDGRSTYEDMWSSDEP